MGLTIHYTLTARDAGIRDIKRIVETLRQKAMDLPFAEVGKVFDRQGDDCDLEKLDRNTLSEDVLWMLGGLGTSAKSVRWRGGREIRVAPTRVIGFTIAVGPGCEPINIAFAHYPKVVKVQTYSTPPHHTRTYRTNKDGWTSRGFTKTQYASDPACGGIKNFLQCHISTITFLEFAQTIEGVEVEICDEGKYGTSYYTDDWRVPEPVYTWHAAQHDPEALVKEIGEWNEMIAAGFGAWKDAIEKAGGDPKDLIGSIQSFPDLEHLEAKGVEKTPEIRESLGLEA